MLRYYAQLHGAAALCAYGAWLLCMGARSMSTHARSLHRPFCSASLGSAHGWGRCVACVMAICKSAFLQNAPRSCEH